MTVVVPSSTPVQSFYVTLLFDLGVDEARRREGEIRAEYAAALGEHVENFTLVIVSSGNGKSTAIFRETTNKNRDQVYAILHTAVANPATRLRLTFGAVPGTLEVSLETSAPQPLGKEELIIMPIVIVVCVLALIIIIAVAKLRQRREKHEREERQAKYELPDVTAEFVAALRRNNEVSMGGRINPRIDPAQARAFSTISPMASSMQKMHDWEPDDLVQLPQAMSLSVPERVTMNTLRSPMRMQTAASVISDDDDDDGLDAIP